MPFCMSASNLSSHQHEKCVKFFGTTISAYYIRMNNVHELLKRIIIMCSCMYFIHILKNWMCSTYIWPPIAFLSDHFQNNLSYFSPFYAQLSVPKRSKNIPWRMHDQNGEIEPRRRRNALTLNKKNPSHVSCAKKGQAIFCQRFHGSGSSVVHSS